MINNKSAILICDLWDTFCWRPTVDYIEVLALKINFLIKIARSEGLLIVHAPSGCTERFYKGTEGQLRAKSAPHVTNISMNKWYPPEDKYPLPIESAWNESFIRTYDRQHPSVIIDHSKDIISENGKIIYNYYKMIGIEKVFVTGLHLNGCLLSRSFGVRALKEIWNMDVSIIPDLTDVLSYGDRETDINLMVKYIEKYWCTTISSESLIEAIKNNE